MLVLEHGEPKIVSRRQLMLSHDLLRLHVLDLLFRRTNDLPALKAQIGTHKGTKATMMMPARPYIIRPANVSSFMC
jgi:hypothetical protein